MSDLCSGTVKWFNKTKGFGFIRMDSGSEIFAHVSSIVTDGFKTLVEGEKVEFIIIDGSRGPQAQNIISVDSSITSSSKAQTRSWLTKIQLYAKRLSNKFV